MNNWVPTHINWGPPVSKIYFAINKWGPQLIMWGPTEITGGPNHKSLSGGPWLIRGGAYLTTGPQLF